MQRQVRHRAFRLYSLVDGHLKRPRSARPYDLGGANNLAESTCQLPIVPARRALLIVIQNEQAHRR
jgi:hypothetical protein